MGLDGVELVMEMEDHFGIEIPDADAERLVTLGGIHAYLCTRLKGRRISGTPCASRATFIRVRDGLGAICGIDPRRIRPSVRVGDVIPARHLRHQLDALESNVGLRLPNVFVWPRILLALSFAIAIVAGVWLGVVAGFAAWLLTLVVGMPVTNSGARASIVADDSVRHWIRLIHRTNGLPDSMSWTEHKIWIAVRTLVSQQFGVAADDLVPATHIIHDLGAD